MRKIYGQMWYKPKEIARQRMIVNSKNSDSEVSNYNFILELIKSGRLRAKDYSTGPKGRPYWLVPESEIKRYHETLTEVN